jgi:hypothetical protein
MPPSGYNNTQAESVCDFLHSCVTALIQENRGHHDSQTAIRREIDSITRDFKHEKRHGFERDLLGLTRAFYEALLKGCPERLDELTEHTENCLADFRSRILDIHVARLR